MIVEVTAKVVGNAFVENNVILMYFAAAAAAASGQRRNLSPGSRVTFGQFNLA